ncbi:MAG: class I SAM-dependent methyltransferase [Nitrospirota bacterium]
MNEFDGSNWSKAGFAQEYRDNADIYVVERARMRDILKSFYIHFMRNNRRKRVLDLGCGDGVVAHELLKIDGSISATLLDGSQHMLKTAEERLKKFEKVHFINASFQDILRKEVLDRDYDFIVSSLAIHHLTMKEKKALFRKIFHHLYPKGYFVNIDCVLAPTDGLEQWYMSLWREWIDEKKKRVGIEGNYYDDIIRRYKDNKDNKPDTLGGQLSALKSVGFRDVDCFYKYGPFAIFGGRKPKEMET